MNIYKKIRNKIDLRTYSIGVKLKKKENEEIFQNTDFEEVKGSKRYCEYMKRASQGDFLEVRKENLSCVTAEIMLGFKKPREIEMDMRLDIKGLYSVLLFPLDKFPTKDIDCVILIINPKHAMDIIEAYRKAFRKSLDVHWGLYSGICSEVTASVIKNKDINFLFFFSGSRIYTGFDDCELICGIHETLVDDIFGKLIQISEDRKMDLQLVKV